MQCITTDLMIKINLLDSTELKITWMIKKDKSTELGMLNLKSTDLRLLSLRALAD